VRSLTDADDGRVTLQVEVNTDLVTVSRFWIERPIERQAGETIPLPDKAALAADPFV
jgi:hypothetical protein